MENFYSNYGKTQNGIVFNFLTEVYLEDPSLAEAFHLNLKFNQAFHCDALLLMINRNILSNASYCIQLSEVITCKKVLSTLVIKIADDVDSKLIMNLNQIFEVVKLHNSLQFLILVNNSNKKLPLGKEIENNIVSLLSNSSKLVCLGIFKFALSNPFVTNLSNAIELSSSLKAFGIESDGVSEQAVDKLVMNGVGKSKSLLAVLMRGFELSGAKIKEYTQVKKTMKIILRCLSM